MKRGHKAGVGKVVGEFDKIRLLEGDASADLAPSDLARIRTLKAFMRGAMMDWLAHAVGDSKGDPVRVATLDAFLWLMKEMRGAAMQEQNPSRFNKMFAALCAVDNKLPLERELAMAVGVAMAIQGDAINRRIYSTQAELKRWIHAHFPRALAGAKGGGRSTLHRALTRWGIICKPR
jgi:hypothetical protein